MQGKSNVLSVIVIGCGTVALSIGIVQYIEPVGNRHAVELEQIVVAASDINIGETLDAQNLKLEKWPADRVPEGAVRDLEEVEHQYPRTRLYAGEPIVQVNLMDSRNGGFRPRWRRDRVVAIKVPAESLGSDLVHPGDRVEISLVVPGTATKTILHNVKVFGVESQTERRKDAEGSLSNTRTVSLLIRPEQAETLMLASELGELRVGLPDHTVASERLK